MKPTIGRIVHFVLPNGAHRPAIVVNGPFGDGIGTSVNLQIFLDPANDTENVIALTGTMGASIHGAQANVYSRFEDANGVTPGTWHWPEREG